MFFQQFFPAWVFVRGEQAVSSLHGQGTRAGSRVPSSSPRCRQGRAAGRAELQAGLVSNHSEGLVALEIRYPQLGSLCLSWLEQVPGAPKRHQTETSPAATHCTSKCALMAAARGCLKHVVLKLVPGRSAWMGCCCVHWQGMLWRLPGAWHKHEKCCQK